MPGQVITVAQQKGGSGKTTLSVNLAVAFAQMGHKVAVIDSDAQGSLGRWFMTRLEQTGGEPGVDFSTASAWGVAYEVDKYRKTHDVIIIDTPPKIDSDMRPALRSSSLVVVPIAASEVDMWATEGVLELAAREGKVVMAVLNRAKSGTRLAAKMLEQLGALDVVPAATVLANRVVYAESLGKGLGVAEVSRNAPATEEIKALTAEVDAALGALSKQAAE